MHMCADIIQTFDCNAIVDIATSSATMSHAMFRIKETKVQNRFKIDRSLFIYETYKPNELRKIHFGKVKRRSK